MITDDNNKSKSTVSSYNSTLEFEHERANLRPPMRVCVANLARAFSHWIVCVQTPGDGANDQHKEGTPTRARANECQLRYTLRAKQAHSERE